MSLQWYDFKIGDQVKVKATGAIKYVTETWANGSVFIADNPNTIGTSCNPSELEKL